MLFFGIFLLFLVFFPLPPTLEIFLPTSLPLSMQTHHVIFEIP